MSDQRTIVRELSEAAARGESVVLASVVRTEGSSYRGVGTRMLVRPDDSTVGLVSGGCLEADLVERARQVRSKGRPELVTFDSLAEDDLVWGFGLGCNGLVELLVEPLSPERAAPLAAMLGGALDGDAPVSVATVVHVRGAAGPAVGARALIALPEGGVERDGGWGDETLLARVVADAREIAGEARRGAMREYPLPEGGEARVAFELVLPSVRLVLCGSGPDAVPVARLALSLGWQVTVVDHRPVALSRPERFAGARVVECADARDLANVVSLARHSAVVVMSHNYPRDVDYLDAVLASGAGYVGVLGPRSRSERMLAELAARGRSYEREELEARLFGPVGLDIGAEGPDAIALAIVAEVAAVSGGRSGGHLRERRAPIHGGAEDLSALPQRPGMPTA